MVKMAIFVVVERYLTGELVLDTQNERKWERERGSESEREKDGAWKANFSAPLTLFNSECTFQISREFYLLLLISSTFQFDQSSTRINYTNLFVCHVNSVIHPRLLSSFLYHFVLCTPAIAACPVYRLNDSSELSNKIKFRPFRCVSTKKKEMHCAIQYKYSHNG